VAVAEADPAARVHAVVSWDLRGRASYRSEVMAHPAVHLVFEPHRAAVFGVHRRRYVRTLADEGWAVGTKFLPGGFAAVTDRPARELTDEVLALEAVADMRAANPGCRVSEIAERHHVSTRTLQRLFGDYVGVSPKWVPQRYRLHEAIEQLGTREGIEWTRFALDLGYFDHAHFIRDFRAVVGRLPSQYAAEATA
jgi:AraC-like DNA-binding protein